jgi:polysaccharide pyruvyl transferase WcaK-like protein
MLGVDYLHDHEPWHNWPWEPERAVRGVVMHQSEHAGCGWAPCHLWVGGILYYYLLTGSAEALEKARAIGADYVQTFLDVVEALAAASERNEFVFIPNATRQGMDAPRNNDLFVIEEIRRRATEVLPDQVSRRIHWVDYDVNTAGIRRILRVCQALVTSRFHAMVAGLSLGIPTLVISWSHKYGEVLEQFDLDAWEIGFDDPEMDVVTSVRQLIEAKEEVQRRIRENWERVRSLAENQFQDLERWLS